MFKNYLKIAWRNLLRSKVYSFINILGLAIGMTATILILLWIQNEVSYDQFHKKLDRIFVVNNRDVTEGVKNAWPWTPTIMGPTLKADYAEVEETIRYNDDNPFLLTVGETRLIKSAVFTDPAFLTTFSFPLVQGNAATALNGLNNIVITEATAKSLFGNERAMGKTIRLDSTANFTVTGIVKDLPNNTSFSFDLLLPMQYRDKIGWSDSSWENNNLITFVLLKDAGMHGDFDRKIKKITTEHLPDNPLYKSREVFTQPFKDAWLYSKQENGKYVGGRIDMVRLFSIIAIFILLIACINFMNLSTARSEKRAKEVGIRKVVGAQKRSLIFQFIGESILLSFIAFIIAVIIVSISLPAFGKLTDKQLHLIFNNPAYWLIAIAFILFSGLLAGSYPAFYLSSFNPTKVLKGLFKTKTTVNPRKVLVVIQFTFAVILIISTLIVARQINYAQSRDNGYDKNDLVFVNMQGDIRKHYKVIRDELVSKGAAISVTKSMSPITTRYSDGWGWSWTGSTEADKSTDFVRMSADADFVKTTGTKLVMGRDIDIYKYPGDSSAVLLNETALKMMHLRDPLNTILKADGNEWRVVGVVKDFVYESPYTKIQQLAVFGPKSWFTTIHFKLNPAHSVKENLAIAEKVFKEQNPDYPFEYKFADDEYAIKFKEEQKIGTMAGLFAGLTILISCLGLFALSTFMAETRIKEIGVRKVLGASAFRITSLLSKDFLKLVFISCIIASPVAWYIMKEWLSNYEYRISIGWWVFVATVILVMLIAVITVSFQSVKAALANPVKALRTE